MMAMMFEQEIPKPEHPVAFCSLPCLASWAMWSETVKEN